VRSPVIARGNASFEIPGAPASVWWRRLWASPWVGNYRFHPTAHARPLIKKSARMLDNAIQVFSGRWPGLLRKAWLDTRRHGVSAVGCAAISSTATSDAACGPQPAQAGQHAVRRRHPPGALKARYRQAARRCLRRVRWLTSVDRCGSEVDRKVLYAVQQGAVVGGRLAGEG
jgi:hypothetical protein